MISAFEKRSPTIFIIQVSKTRLASDSLVLDSFDKIYIPLSEKTNILGWIQQHQPDLIILDLQRSEITDWSIVTILKLDWLTRNIPILVISNEFSNRFQCVQNFNCDACLIKPYTTVELEEVICSLVYVRACETYANSG